MTDEDTESDPPRFLAYEGFSFLPISAGISLLATLSLLVTLVTKIRGLPDFAQMTVGFVLFVTTLAALINSLLALVVLLIRGLAASGTLVIGGLRLSETTLGVVFLACYGSPWIPALLTFYGRWSIVR